MAILMRKLNQKCFKENTAVIFHVNKKDGSVSFKIIKDEYPKPSID